MLIPNEVVAAVRDSSRELAVTRAVQVNWAACLGASHIWHRRNFRNPKLRCEVDAEAVRLSDEWSHRPDALRMLAFMHLRKGRRFQSAAYTRAYLKAVR